MFMTSTFNSVLKYLPRRRFDTIIRTYNSDRYRKTYSTKDHLHIMLAGQLSGCSSLRDLETLFTSQDNYLYHLGLTSVSRSTISDANNRIDFNVYKELAMMLIENLASAKQELSNLVTILDSSTIKALDRGNEWAIGPRYSTKGLKLHLQYDHTNGHPEYVEVTDSTVNDITVAQELQIKKDRIYVFDKGYSDYNWWHKIIGKGSTFVTRLKKNAKYKALEELAIEEKDKGFILKDQIIELTNKRPRAHKVNLLAGHKLRLISIKHPDIKRKDPLIIVSNDCEASAEQLAGWYKQRWSIEIVFKWLKQNLKLKKFMGQSRNAYMIQIFIAIIAYVLLKMYSDDNPNPKRRLKDVTTVVKNSLFNRPKLEKYRKRMRQKEMLKAPLLIDLDSFVRQS